LARCRGAAFFFFFDKRRGRSTCSGFPPQQQRDRFLPFFSPSPPKKTELDPAKVADSFFLFSLFIKNKPAASPLSAWNGLRRCFFRFFFFLKKEMKFYANFFFLRAKGSLRHNPLSFFPFLCAARCSRGRPGPSPPPTPS